VQDSNSSPSEHESRALPLRGLVWFRAVITNFKELSPFQESACCAAGRELPNILWNPKLHYLVHKSLSLSQINPFHAILHISKIRFVIIYPCSLGLCSGVFPSEFPMNILCSGHLSLIRATFPAHTFLRNLIILIVLG
jgi:hypothetical protein